jgi:hypothetical protein
LLSARIVAAADEPALTKEQMKQFLLTAKVIKSGPAHKGITDTLRLTLTDGTITHDAHFQPIDEHAIMKEMATRSMSICVDMVRFEWPCFSVTSNIVNLLFAWLPYRQCPNQESPQLISLPALLCEPVSSNG